MPQLQRHFFQLMSREIAEDQQLITLLSKSSADERVAALRAERIDAQCPTAPPPPSSASACRAWTSATTSASPSRPSAASSAACRSWDPHVENKEIEILDIEASNDGGPSLSQAPRGPLRAYRPPALRAGAPRLVKQHLSRSATAFLTQVKKLRLHAIRIRLDQSRLQKHRGLYKQ
jgi:hypothetical protein